MPIFSYRARTGGGEWIEGQVDRSNIEDAEKYLRGMGLMFITFSEVSFDEVVDDSFDRLNNTVLYEFEAVQSDGTLVSGTVQADSRLGAVRFLIREHKVVPKYVAEADADEDYKRKLREKGLQDVIADLDETEKSIFTKGCDFTKYLSETQKLYIQEIDRLIVQSKNFSDDLSLRAAEKFRLERLVADLTDARLRENFREMSRFRHTLQNYLQKVQKRHGKFTDKALAAFFDALKFHDNLYYYAQLIRTGKYSRKKLFRHEFWRFVRSGFAIDPWRKLWVIARSGTIASTRAQHPVLFEIQRFVGALLFFYILLFGFTYYAYGKDIGVEFYFVQSLAVNVLLYRMVLMLFFVYCFLTFAVYFFGASRLKNGLMFLPALMGVGLAVVL